MSNCSQMDELMELVLLGEATKQQTQEFMEHIENCTECCEVYQMLRQIDDDLAYEVEPPEGMANSVMEAVFASGVRYINHDTAVKRNRRKHTLRYLTVAACFLLVCSVAVKMATSGFFHIGASKSASRDTAAAMDTKAEEMAPAEESVAATDDSADIKEVTTADAEESTQNEVEKNAAGESASDRQDSTMSKNLPGDYDEYIIVTGTLPAEIEERTQNTVDGEAVIEIDEETAQKLIDDGYDVIVINDEPERIAVWYTP